MLQPNRHLNHGWQSFSLGITLVTKPHCTRYCNPRIGLAFNPIARHRAFSSEDSVRHYQHRGSSLYTLIAERQAVATRQDKTCPRRTNKSSKKKKCSSICSLDG
ncbi:hypothetical protein EVAR_72283_1 [Eumeta japonica]|uniref:Uncharacterized protein n=1 Tax=Eumeta variegata TaxID=151549 RepID=A0A4C1T293_EUMVA|nr:hypothetical protein EVAR_72283_1 [Eumeta japonica]